jgi:hypothetical protein
MVRGSQVRFQSIKNTFSIFKTIYKVMPPLSDLPVRFSFPLPNLSRLAAAELADHGTTPHWPLCYRPLARGRHPRISIG